MQRRILFLVVLCLLFTGTGFSQPARVSDFYDQLSTITDASLRRTLENSIKAGLINTPVELEETVSRAEQAANKNALGFYSARENSREDIVRQEILEYCAPIHKLDRDFVEVLKTSDFRATNYLFEDLIGKLPKSYADTYELCKLHDPKADTNDTKRLEKEIDAYLLGISNDPVIKHALKVTNTTIEDLKRNWFGTGLGFEHVFAGELKGTKVGGYHWWYVFYGDERAGFTQVKESLKDHGNPNVFTGSFHWDPDGPGPLPTGYKRIGGFLLGNSAQSMFALGHIAVEVARKHGKVPGALRFNADVNGQEFTWQLYTQGGTVRTLYPLGNSESIINGGSEDDKYDFQKKNKNMH